MTELGRTGDERRDSIIKLLGEHPSGLGFREIRDLLRDIMAPGTLKIRLDELVKSGHVRFEPEDWRQGQKKVFILTEAYSKYLVLLDKIEEVTREFVSELNKYEGSPELVDLHFNHLIRKIMQFYSIPNIVGSIRSWNYAWTRDRDTVVQVLTLLYVSFHEVDDVLNSVVREHVQVLDRRIRERREDIEKNYPDVVEVLDCIDLKFLNFWGDPEFLLEILEKGTCIKSE